jgi:ASC-1-like (ASCH) protein
MSNQVVHELKITPEYFALQVSGDKRYEVRRNDRDFQVGDTLILNEWDGENYTGRCITVIITCMLTAEQFDGIIDPQFVILGTSDELEAVL